MKNKSAVWVVIHPLTLFLLTIILFCLLSFSLKIEDRGFWLSEGGIVETMSALGYFLCALLILYFGRWTYLKKYHYFFLIVNLFGMRELDFDKRFTTMGILKSKFYVSDNVPITEKTIGLMVVALLVYIVVSIIKNHGKTFFYNMDLSSPVDVGVILVFISLIAAKTMDGIGRKLSDFGLTINEQAMIHFETLEEVLELGIPMMLISTFYIYFSNVNLIKHST